VIVLGAWAVWQLAFWATGIFLARRGGQPAWRHSGALLALSEALQVAGIAIAVLAQGSLRTLALVWLLLPWPFTAVAFFAARRRRRSAEHVTAPE
jgi:hypothetical protein